MFTGIITDIGTISKIEQNGDKKFTIDTKFNMDEINIGASICCSGCCLTVTSKTVSSFTAEISEETLSRTNISTWQVGTKINLERSLRMGDEMGGHIVTGHIDGLAEITEIEDIGDSQKITLKAPTSLKKFIASKGSVALNGVSLTVNNVNDDLFDINIISHTRQNTTFADIMVSDKVNIEIDILARYVSRLSE